ncbi:MAG: preprotein translocase subunit SecY [Candidatus Brocadiia bacterium]|jgi:preprotein translocase subunit SecY
MLDTLANAFRIPELRRRILITVILLAICRVGVFIPVPGADIVALSRFFENAGRGGGAPLLNLANMFSGGGLQRCGLFALGVMPYISASIIFQLLVQVVPTLKKVSEEGEAGRKKINQWTRYATVLLCFFQGPMMIKALSVSGAAIFPASFGYGMFLLAGLLMTAGSLLLMWIGEQIDEYGIGNGISLIIMANIMSRLPAAITELESQFQFTLNPAEGQIGILKVGFLLVLFVAVVFCIIYITQGQRRIPFQQAKQVRGQRVYGGMKHYLPIQVNAANVIPIIFAQSLLMFPMYGAQALMGATGPGGHWESNFFYGVSKAVMDSLGGGSSGFTFVHTFLYVVLIFFFCYFWTAITFNPTDMAKNLQENGSFIPGIRPGHRTAEYLERVMTRITLPGAASLALIAVVPGMMMRGLDVHYIVAEFFGGTSILIAVGVALDFVKKVEAQLLVRHYDGFTRVSRRRF